MHSWYGADELRRLVPFIVIGRSGFPGPGGLEMPAVSSTDVRRRLAHGGDAEAVVPRLVLDYIRERKLYGA